mmetsp:Transcript_15639/g.31436  ORF Transcript_15639/g.31436 Transcript_15639/m.31436 type:complete len:216 (+) Transcript_15639:32-679(+)
MTLRHTFERIQECYHTCLHFCKLAIHVRKVSAYRINPFLAPLARIFTELYSAVRQRAALPNLGCGAVVAFGEVVEQHGDDHVSKDNAGQQHERREEESGDDGIGRIESEDERTCYVLAPGLARHHLEQAVKGAHERTVVLLPKRHFAQRGAARIESCVDRILPQSGIQDRREGFVVIHCQVAEDLDCQNGVNHHDDESQHKGAQDTWDGPHEVHN